MATSTKSSGEASAACPLCDDYSGPPSSVEAHISRKTDTIHQGEVGRAHRDDLQRQVADTGGVDSTDDRSGSEVEAVDQWEVEPDEDPAETSENDESDGEGDSGNAESPPSGGEAPSPATDTPEADPGDGEVPGIPLPFDKTTLALVLGLIVVLALLYRTGYFTTDDGDDQDESDDGEEIEEAATGLVAG